MLRQRIPFRKRRAEHPSLPIPDNVGVRAWRIAMYASTTNPGEVLAFVAAFVEERTRTYEFAVAGAPPLQVTTSSQRFFPAGLPAAWTFAPPGSAAIHPFDAGPLRGRRHLILQVEKEDGDGEYSLVFYGNSWPFRSRFEDAGVEGGYVEVSGEKEYVRCLRNVLFERETKDRITSILGDRVLKGHAVFLLDEIKENTDAFVEWLVNQESTYTR